MMSINIEKKDLWLLVAMFVFIAGVGIVIAYRSGGPPGVFGHSGEELEVNISGTIKTLQQALDDEDIGAPSESPKPGTMCGMSLTGAGAPAFLCDGFNPSVSCPFGYTSKLFAAMGALGGNWYTCYKN